MSTIQAFKVVRPNLAAFKDERFKYRLNAARLAPKVSFARIICEPGLLHCSPSAPMAAQYGRWPYRLLSVEVAEKDIVARRDDKYGVLRLFVVEEAPVHLCWGPNGRAVEKIIHRAETLTKEEVEKLNAAWNAAWNAARNAAWNAAWNAARNAADAAGNTAGFAAARNAAWNAAWNAADAARNAADAARNAAGATAIADLVGQFGFTQTHFDLLLGPWRKVFGDE